MMNCSRCGHTADETKEVACPQCGTPLRTPQSIPAQAGSLPGAMPMMGMGSAPMQSPNVRVSLTGEVMEDPASAPPPRFVGGGTSPVQMTKAGAGIAAQKKIDDQRAKNALLFRIFSLFCFLLIIAGGTFWYLKLRTSPDGQIKQYFTAMQNGELATIYNDSDLSDELKEQYPDSKAFEEKVRDGAQHLPGGGDALNSLLKGWSTQAAVGKIEVSGSEATVPVTVRYGDRKQQVTYTMRNVWGTWKVVDKGTGVVGFLSKVIK